ncbi:MFS transporter [Pseudalkalibacillus sp. SCS-8]|uniref:MFS transporter n=1 Tax=Pseudalkalibacillus nanhaiensis TaxID=3115291 RepID=UPI0032DADA5B
MGERRRGIVAIYVVLFLLSLSLHIQFPIFTPYAVALGATSFFISILMSVSSFANLCGNLIAGPLIDMFGKKQFIVVPLFISGILMAGHGFATGPDGLLVLRLVNGLVLAFMTPACFALLSGYARNSHEQGKNMAFNGLLITIANILAPLIGGHLVEHVDFRGAYFVIGSALLLTAVFALLFIKEFEPITVHRKKVESGGRFRFDQQLVAVYFVSFTLMYVHGTLMYELPFLMVEEGVSMSHGGKLFSIIGLGTLVVVCMTWIHRISASIRTMVGMLVLGFSFYQMVMPLVPITFHQLLFLIGMGLGVLFPAVTTLLTENTDKSKHGTAFGILSAVFSLGMITSSLIAGAFRDMISPYFITFVVIGIAVTVIGMSLIHVRWKPVLHKKH